MARYCLLTGKKTRSANHVSKANNKNKRKQYPNLVRKKFFLPALGEDITLRLSTKALKTINRIGLAAMLHRANLPLKALLPKEKWHLLRKKKIEQIKNKPSQPSSSKGTPTTSPTTAPATS